MAIETLTEAEFGAAAKRAGNEHWKNAVSRWSYHQAAIDCVRRVAPDRATDVLELGTMGISIVKGSDTMDYAEKWKAKHFTPTFQHDAREMPWPATDGRYAVFVALRVFHHLRPHQAACFHEARRIARNIVIVTPTDYDVKALRDTSSGIEEAEVMGWNGGLPPTECLRFGDWRGNLYFWDEATLKRGMEQFGAIHGDGAAALVTPRQAPQCAS